MTHAEGAAGRLAAGRPLGSRYVLGAQIGRGAMGTVWRATTRGGGPPVAVKVLRPELAAEPDVVARFVQERNVLLRLSHPRLVRLRDLVAEGEVLALVMDLVEGSDLGRYIRGRGPLPVAVALRTVAAAAEGLAAVHAAGVVHRDLKPANILLEDGQDPTRLRITDFGIARVVGGPALTAYASVVGTPDYLAPEVVRGGEPTAAADVYAAGVVLYELVAGCPPFHADHPMTVLHRQVAEQPRRPRAIPPPVWAEAIRCLAKDPGERPAATVLADRLSRLAAAYEAGGPVAALPPGAAGPAAVRIPRPAPAPAAAAAAAAGPGGRDPGGGTPVGGDDPGAAPATAPRRWPRRLARAVAAGVLAVGMAAAVAAVSRPSAGSAAGPRPVPGPVPTLGFPAAVAGQEGSASASSTRPVSAGPAVPSGGADAPAGAPGPPRLLGSTTIAPGAVGVAGADCLAPQPAGGGVTVQPCVAAEPGDLAVFAVVSGPQGARVDVTLALLRADARPAGPHPGKFPAPSTPGSAGTPTTAASTTPTASAASPPGAAPLARPTAAAVVVGPGGCRGLEAAGPRRAVVCGPARVAPARGHRYLLSTTWQAPGAAGGQAFGPSAAW